MSRNNRRKNYTMRERISYHTGRSKTGGKRGAYSKGYVNGARTSARKARQYYGKTKNGGGYN